MDYVKISRHAVHRMNQRGFREQDIDLVLRCGTLISDDTFMLRNKDVDREIRDCKRELQQLERLRNSKIVVANGTLVTCFHASTKHLKTVLRRERVE
jgi:hypothetical protein